MKFSVCGVVSDPLVEFLTVHIYTCSRNCWPENAEFVAELAIAEYDRDSKLVGEAASRICAAISGLQHTSCNSA